MKKTLLLALSSTLLLPADAQAQIPGGQTGEQPAPTGAEAKCTIKGTAKDDRLTGTRKNDVICGRAGDDVIEGRGGDDVIRGGGGSDILYGGSGADVLDGGRGRDQLFAGRGTDSLQAKDGRRDLVNGGAAHDVALADKKDRLKNVEEKAPGSGKPSIGGGAPDVVTVSTATSAAAVETFWTPQKLNSAQPPPRGGFSAGGGTPFTSASVRADGRNLMHRSGETSFFFWETGYLAADSYSPAVGRIAFENPPGNPSSCTATVVARNLLITAAHCLYNIGTGTWSQNIIFFPGQIGSQAPYGWWAADNAFIHSEYYTTYAGYPFYPLDYGFITMNWPDAYGRLVGDVTSWFPIYFGGSPGGPKYTEGYPAEGWFGTNCPIFDCYVWINSAPVADYVEVEPGWWEEGSGGQGNGGDSGGPIFEVIDGTWYVTSVISHGGVTYTYDVFPRWYMENTWGPYFNDWVGSLYYSLALV